MPSFLNNLGASFLPQQRKPLINQNAFGFNTQLPRPNSNAQTQQDAEDDFLAQYGKITGARPNRLAYQQAVEEGAPQINRGKWAKLGAMLAAGGAGLGGTPAPQAAQLGISAYETPQRASDDAYKQRMVGLGNLAQFEDSDIQEKIKQLELQRGEHWKSEQNKREDADLKLRQGQDERAGRVTDVQIKNIESEMNKRDTDVWVNPNTGIRWERKPGEMPKPVAQVEATPYQKAVNAGMTAASVAAGQEPTNKAHDERVAASAANVAGIGATSRQEVAKTNAASDAAKSAARIREKATAMKPDDVAKNILLDMATEIEAGTLPPNAASYLRFENGVPVADRGYSYGDEAKATEDSVRAFIARSITRSRGGGNQTPAPAAGPKKDPLGIRK